MDARTPTERAREMIDEWCSLVPPMPADLRDYAEAKMLERIAADCGLSATWEAFHAHKRDTAWMEYQAHLGPRPPSEEEAMRRAFTAGWAGHTAFQLRWMSGRSS